MCRLGRWLRNLATPKVAERAFREMDRMAEEAREAHPKACDLTLRQLQELGRLTESRNHRK